MNQREILTQRGNLNMCRMSHNIVAALIAGASVLTGLATLTSAPTAFADTSATYAEPTYSSPIALSQDKGYVWSVNPAAGSVSVISTTTDSKIGDVAVGKEPQSVAVDPNNQFAYVANAADNTLSVIRISSLSPFSATVARTYVTGAEPWNVVVSPDGKRVFVSNSAQDTITVLDATAAWPAIPTIIGNYDMNSSACNAANPNRHFQPRGLAVTLDSTKLYVTRFLSFVKPGGAEGTDTGKEGLVCRLDFSTGAYGGTGITAATAITLAPQDTGFKDANANATSAYPNQMQSIVIRGDNAYLPSIAASPSGPLKFNVDTHAFVNVVGSVNIGAQADLGALNMHLGARLPESGKKKLFFANPWAIAFTNQGGAGNAYAVSSGSDLLVKLNVDAGGVLSFTNGVSTTRYIDLNDPNTPATAGANAGVHPLGIVIKNGTKAYVMNKLSGNVSVVDLTADVVTSVIALTPLPASGTLAEQLRVGAMMFFGSRGHFERPAGTTVSTDERLSSDGWQACASCHFNGWTDGEIWGFASGPRKSVPLNGTWNPHDKTDQRMLNYSAVFDEVEDFEINVRNISGPGQLAAPLNGTTIDPNHGLIISDTGDINTAPFAVNAFAKANAGRPQVTVRLPGSSMSWPALTALKEWVRFAVRTPNGALSTNELTYPAGGATGNSDATGALADADVAAGRTLFAQAGCGTCHSGGKWTTSRKDFVSPTTDFSTEGSPLPTSGNPISTVQYLNRFLIDVNSFNLNVNGAGNAIGTQPQIGAVEKNEKNFDALGRDYNADGKGIGFNPPSLLGIAHLPPYYHNGACETLTCVVEDANHRAKGLRGMLDPLTTAAARAKVVAFLRSLDADTPVLGPAYLPNVLRDSTP